MALDCFCFEVQRKNRNLSIGRDRRVELRGLCYHKIVFTGLMHCLKPFHYVFISQQGSKGSRLRKAIRLNPLVLLSDNLITESTFASAKCSPRPVCTRLQEQVSTDMTPMARLHA
jgi:hypothetical protein